MLYFLVVCGLANPGWFGRWRPGKAVLGRRHQQLS